MKSKIVPSGKDDSESIIRINEILESDMKKGKVSDDLYGNVKG